MNTLAQTHLQLMNDLWMAIERNELRLLYQPKFHAPAGPLLGFEALLRWQHPKQGLLTPDLSCHWRKRRGLSSMVLGDQ